MKLKKPALHTTFIALSFLLSIYVYSSCDASTSTSVTVKNSFKKQVRVTVRDQWGNPMALGAMIKSKKSHTFNLTDCYNSIAVQTCPSEYTWDSDIADSQCADPQAQRWDCKTYCLPTYFEIEGCSAQVDLPCLNRR